MKAKTKKMSFEMMKGVLNHVLTRDEMKEVMAGSGNCGICATPAGLYVCTTPGVNSSCRCPWDGLLC